MPFLLARVISSVALSDTFYKAKFSLQLSRLAVAKSCLSPVEKTLGCLVVGEDSLYTFLEFDCTIIVFNKEDHALTLDHCGKDTEIPIYFQGIGKNYSHTLGNLSQADDVCRW